MKTSSWDCRGLGNPQTVQDLYHMVEEKKPDLVFLIEIKLRAEKCTRLKKRLNCKGCFVVEPIGKMDDLALLWNSRAKVEVLNYTQRHISAWITEGEGNERWLLTGFYGHPKTVKRAEAWNLLLSLRPRWCVVWDINEILAHDEKVGGKPR